MVEHAQRILQRKMKSENQRRLQRAVFDASSELEGQLSRELVEAHYQREQEIAKTKKSLSNAEWRQDGKDWILFLVESNRIIARLTEKSFSLGWFGQVDFNASQSLVNQTFVENADLAILQEIAERICGVTVEK